ncbi:hypothetical protein Tco_0863657 [Tanacetum coccineum]
MSLYAILVFYVCLSELGSEGDDVFGFGYGPKSRKEQERKLQGVELDYLELEKLILPFVYATRRLRRPEKSGLIAKWDIKLGEHDIKFRGRNSVKGQVLADFLVETPSAEGEGVEIKKPETTNEESKSEDMWKLYIDRASSSNGSGTGLMLVNPEGKEYTYAA